MRCVEHFIFVVVRAENPCSQRSVIGNGRRAFTASTPRSVFSKNHFLFKNSRRKSCSPLNSPRVLVLLLGSSNREKFENWESPISKTKL